MQSTVFKTTIVYFIAHYLVFSAAQDSTNCGTNKLVCIQSPNDQLTAKIERKDENTFTFHLSGKVSAAFYVAVGFSKDQQMGQDAVVGCFSTSVKTFINPQGHTASQQVNWNAGSPANFMTKSEGDLLTCSFDLPSKIDAGSGISFDLNDPIFLLLASGPQQNMMIQQHSATPSRHQVVFSSLKKPSNSDPTVSTTTSSTPTSGSTQSPSKASIMGSASDAKYLAMFSSLTVMALTFLKNSY